MITIYLPTSNSNLLNDLTPAVLSDACRHLFQSTDYVTVSEQRSSGRYVKIVNTETDETHFVCFSNPHNDSRNAHLMQFVSPTYVEYYNAVATNKHMSIYLIDQSGNDRTDYIKMFYRCFATLGIRILNLDGIAAPAPFSTYDDVSNYRKKTSLRNSKNRSTYFTDDDDQISIYGKTFGANAMESFIFGLTIQKIAPKPVIFYPVVDNKSSALSTEQTRILTNTGITFGDVIPLLQNGTAKPVRDTSRNQTVFKYNLLQKFGDQQCYLCGCDVDHLIIASHIERVTDIDNNDAYDTDTKAARSADGDNGFWLCASHDKMFEYGIIYFENNTAKIRDFVNEQQRDYILQSIFDLRKVYFPGENSAEFTISPDHYNENTEQYLQKHRERLAIV